ncbi:ABC transporter ATP-binding protein [Actinoplanes sp. CA-142083]|uniref:ABC transporter ATP-binding protein n=1 Tax=Actinoplanes sp. CA-142083 TaxID=3239903 RepID=UPI003D8CCA65
MITVSGLRKSFGSLTVLDGIDFHVPAGTVYALLGPNGAGKTTMVEILTTLIAPDAGEVTIDGHDLRRSPGRIRQIFGVTGQFSAVDSILSGRENLRLITDLRHLGARAGRAKADELLERFDLTEAADRSVMTWSGGMKRRLDLAMTLIGDPKLIFLDEPTTGLDPRGRRAIWEIVRDLVANDGVTVFLTTQYLDEADRLADTVALLDHGRLVASGSAEELKSSVGADSTLDDVFFTLTGGIR